MNSAKECPGTAKVSWNSDLGSGKILESGPHFVTSYCQLKSLRISFRLV